MSYRPEDLELDEAYWQSLLSEAEVNSAVPVTQAGRAAPRQHADVSAVRPKLAGHEPHAHGKDSPERGAAASSPEQPPADSLAHLWNTLHESQQTHSWLELDVTGVNRGGLIVHFHGLRGFVPSSHLSAMTPDMDEPARRSLLADHIGRKLHLRVIELEPEQDRAVFSERSEPEPGEAATEIPEVLREIQAGEMRRGKVTNLTAFGAFVDLGGYEGLVHVSELSWSRVGHPRDMLAIGQEVDVYVIGADPNQGRIALSLKRAKSDPWRDIERRFSVGQIVQGVITNVVQFGAFAKVEEDLEGLIHVSELAEGSFLHPRNIVREGDHVTARVIGVDGGARRLALSLRGIS